MRFKKKNTKVKSHPGLPYDPHPSGALRTAEPDRVIYPITLSCFGLVSRVRRQTLSLPERSGRVRVWRRTLCTLIRFGLVLNVARKLYEAPLGTLTCVHACAGFVNRFMSCMREQVLFIGRKHGPCVPGTSMVPRGPSCTILHRMDMVTSWWTLYINIYMYIYINIYTYQYYVI